jgi:hypothetical protein
MPHYSPLSSSSKTTQQTSDKLHIGSQHYNMYCKFNFGQYKFNITPTFLVAIIEWLKIQVTTM